MYPVDAPLDRVIDLDMDFLDFVQDCRAVAALQRALVSLEPPRCVGK